MSTCHHKTYDKVGGVLRKIFCLVYLIDHIQIVLQTKDLSVG